MSAPEAKTARQVMIEYLTDALEEITPLKNEAFGWARIEQGNALEHAERKIQWCIDRLTPRDDRH